MPTYQYACTETACGHRFEAVQSFSDDPLTSCPVCEGRLRKVFSAVGVVFKGSGFYRTDSREKPKVATGKDGKDSKDSKDGGKSEQKASASSSDSSGSGSSSGSSASSAASSGSSSSGSAGAGASGSSGSSSKTAAS